MKRSMLVLVAVLVMSIAFPALAGAGPVVPGGVRSKAAAKKAWLNNKYVRKSDALWARKLHAPKRVVADLQKEVKAGRIYIKYYSRGKRGQSYRTGRHVGITYKSDFSGKTYYVHRKYTSYQKNGYQYYDEWRKITKAGCGNGRWELSHPRKKLPPPKKYPHYVDKHDDCGTRLRWTFWATWSGVTHKIVTSTTGPTKIADLPAGTYLSIVEANETSYTALSPASGRYDVKTGSKSSTYNFVNRFIPTPPPPVTDNMFVVAGSFEPTTCMNAGFYGGILRATVVLNTGGSAIALYKWTIDDEPTFTVLTPDTPHLFTYDVTHNVRLEVLNTAGEVATATVAPIYRDSGGSPIDPLGD